MIAPVASANEALADLPSDVPFVCVEVPAVFPADWMAAAGYRAGRIQAQMQR